MAYDNSLIDKRVVERNIAKGLVDPQAFKQAVEALPDRESNCVHVSVEGDLTDDDDIDDIDDDEDEDDDLDESED